MNQHPTSLAPLSASACPPGCLIYVMGASGCGKDTLLNYARGQLSDRDNVIFAHRYITRRPDPDSENHITLGDAEFRARQRAGLFAMAWESHGLRYGVGIEIDLWLSRGLRVVVNGSRVFLSQAWERYPDLLPVLVQVSPTRLRRRLQARGRESAGEIEARLARHLQVVDQVPDYVDVVSNDGPVAEAGEALVQRIVGCHKGAKRR